MRRKESSNRGGFTLIEILVVLVIIMVLASILFPVFSRAREKARQASCMSNMKQIGLALLQYAQDYDEKLPVQSLAISTDTQSTGITYFADPSHSGWEVNWLWAIYPYTKSWKIFVCPSVSQPATGTYAPDWSYPNSITTYAANAVVIGRSIAVIPDASDIVWAQEFDTLQNAVFVRPNGYYANGTGVFLGEYEDWTRPFLSDIHSVGGNLLFCDGHVKWRSQSEICASDFGLINSTVNSGFKACGPNANTGALATSSF